MSVNLSIPELRVIPATPIKLGSPLESLFNDNGKSEIQDEENLKKEFKELQEIFNQNDKNIKKIILSNQEKDGEIERLEKLVTQLENNEQKSMNSDLFKKFNKAESENKAFKLHLNKQRSTKEELQKMMEEFEKTLARVIASKEEKMLEHEKEKEKISSERCDAISHLNNLEVAFQDVHRKYEKSKSTIEQMLHNENAMKKSLEEYKETIENRNRLTEKLKIQANHKLIKANEEIENIEKFNKSEICKLNAQIKTAELKIKSLEETLQRTTSDAKELRKICNELC